MVTRLILALALLACSCRQDMYDRPERRPLGSSRFFADRSASRRAVADTVPRISIRNLPIDPRDLVARGRDRFEIFCAPCHGRDGEGDGVIVQHGFPRPPPYFAAEQMAMQPAAIVKTIAEGKGEMYSYAARVPEQDRWAIAAYIKHLQSERAR